MAGFTRRVLPSYQRMVSMTYREAKNTRVIHLQRLHLFIYERPRIVYVESILDSIAQGYVK
jgi:hypothetical protein